MAAFKVKNLWTVFLTAFFAVLATLGLTAPAAAADAAVQQPAEQPAKGDRSPVTTTEARGGGEAAPAVRRERALPESARPHGHVTAADHRAAYPRGGSRFVTFGPAPARRHPYGRRRGA